MLDGTTCYLWEKFTNARRSLIAPHESGEEMSFQSAFHSCSLGLHNLELSTRKITDSECLDYLKTVRDVIEVDDLKPEYESELWSVRYNRMTVDQKREFSSAVDWLADHFTEEYWEQYWRGELKSLANLSSRRREYSHIFTTRAFRYRFAISSRPGRFGRCICRDTVSTTATKAARK